MLRVVEDIPREIVREIFSYFPSRLAVYVPGSFPWYLGHICTTWRATFLSQSQFWKVIKIEWPPSRESMPDLPLPWYTQRVMEMLRFFLQCNQGSPFSFKLETMFFDAGTHEDPQHIIQVLQILVSESSRWQDVSIDLHPYMVPTLYRIKDDLPLLKSLRISSWSGGRTDYSIPELHRDIFKTAPLLTSISVPCHSRWKFDWSLLTFVHLDALNDNLLYTALSFAVRLKGLEITQSHPISAIEPIKLPSLIYLNDWSSSFLKVLEAPALLDLQIRRQDRDSTSETSIIDFIRRSSCTLRHLSFQKHNASTVKQVLLHAPKVRYLCLEEVANVADVFVWLSSKDKRVPGPLADLEALRIYELPKLLEDNDDLEKLSYMVMSRAKPNGVIDRGLKKLILVNKGRGLLMQDALERLRSSCRVLGVELRYHGCEFCSTNLRDVMSHSHPSICGLPATIY